MKPLALALVLFGIVAVSCTDEPAGPTASTSSTTTTIENDTCERVIADTVTFVEDLLAELDETRLVGFRERRDWSDDLVRLERLGTDLDIRTAVLRCDPGEIRQAVLEQADLSSTGPLSEGIVEMMLAPPTTTVPVTETTVADSTTDDTGSSTSSGG